MQAPSSSRVSSDSGRADQQAAEAEADMTEAGDVGEWLGMDSSKQVVAGGAAVNGQQQADTGQRHRLSRETSSDQMNEVYRHVKHGATQLADLLCVLALLTDMLTACTIS